MLKRPITFTNPLTDEEMTETHYFHISKADLVEMELEEHNDRYEKDGEEFTGMRAKLQRIVDSEDGKAIIAELRAIIRRSYGKKDGERFLKNEEIKDEFMSSEACSQLIFELCTDPEAAAEFVNSIVPANLDQIAADAQKQAAKISAGREAQEKAKQTGAPAAVATPEAAIADAATEAGAAGLDTSAVTEPTLADKIENATAENPAVLTEAEVCAIDSDELKSGLATGRIKIG